MIDCTSFVDPQELEGLIEYPVGVWGWSGAGYKVLSPDKRCGKTKGAESWLKFCWYLCLDARCLRVYSAQAYNTSHCGTYEQGIMCAHKLHHIPGPSQMSSRFDT